MKASEETLINEDFYFPARKEKASLISVSESHIISTSGVNAFAGLHAVYQDRKASRVDFMPLSTKPPSEPQAMKV